MSTSRWFLRAIVFCAPFRGSKLERAHAQDVLDVQEMVKAGLVVPARARSYFEEIEPELYRYPALDPPSFRKRVEETFGPKAGRH